MGRQVFRVRGYNIPPLFGVVGKVLGAFVRFRGIDWRDGLIVVLSGGLA